MVVQSTYFEWEDRNHETMKLGSSSLEVPVVAVGCMRINSLEKRKPSVSYYPHWRKALTSSTMPTYTAAELARKFCRRDTYECRSPREDHSAIQMRDSSGHVRFLQRAYLEFRRWYPEKTQNRVSRYSFCTVPMRWLSLKRWLRHSINSKAPVKCVISAYPTRIRCRSSC